MVSAFFAGAISSVIVSPTEHAKIRIQLQPTNAKTYSGSVDCLRRISVDHGLRGVYKGVTATAGREGFGFAAFFGSYQWGCEQILKPGQTKSDLTLTQVCMLGAFAGNFYWIFCYPFDVVKSSIQADSFTAPKYSSMRDCFSKLYSEFGLKGFARGIAPCLIKSLPASAGTYLGFEYTMRMLNRLEK